MELCGFEGARLESTGSLIIAPRTPEQSLITRTIALAARYVYGADFDRPGGHGDKHPRRCPLDLALVCLVTSLHTGNRLPTIPRLIIPANAGGRSLSIEEPESPASLRIVYRDDFVPPPLKNLPGTCCWGS